MSYTLTKSGEVLTETQEVDFICDKWKCDRAKVRCVAHAI